MPHTVISLYDDIGNAYRAIDGLINTGFNKENISLVSAHKAEKRGGESGETGPGPDIEADIATGLGAGAVTGGLVGILAGLTAISLPVVGPILAAGPIAAALGGAGLGVLTGGLVGALVEAGVPEEQAGYFTEGIRRGATLISVQTKGEETAVAVDILKRFDPVDIELRARKWREADEKGADRSQGDTQPGGRGGIQG